MRNTVVVFLVYWIAGSWLAYMVAGEKMPWLMTHLALPMAVFGGWWFGWLIYRIDWTRARQSRAVWLIAATPALVFLLVLLLRNGPAFGRSTEEVSSTLQWLLALGVFAALAYGVIHAASRSGWRSASALLGVGGIALLFLLTIRFTYMLNYVNYDMATEYLVYAHGSPDIKRALNEIDLLSERTVGDRNIVIAYDDESSWPMSWYMRLYPNARFYGDNPTSDVMTAPVILVGPKNFEKVRPYVARDYVMRPYRRIWWPDQGYFNLTWSDVFHALSDKAARKRLVDIAFYRRFTDPDDPTKPRDLTQWPTRSEMEMYVRRDVAEEVWDLSVLPVASASGSMQALMREREIDLSASAILDGVYDGLPLHTPRAVAVAPDGRLLIADSGNHRIVVLDNSGQFLFSFGSHCRFDAGVAADCQDPDGDGPLQPGDGQFNEPWGIAVDAAGAIYVADTWNGRIQAFDADGTFMRSWGYYNTTNGELGDPYALFGPRGLAIDNGGNVLVADTGNKRILRFTPDGSFVDQAGGGGVILGRFEEPTDLAVDPRDGSVYVADNWNRRIQKLDSSLQPISEWPVPGWESREIYHKPSIAVTGTGDVYITDPEYYRVIVFDQNGELKATFGDYGTDANRFALPNGIDAGAGSDQVIVADADNGRAMLFPALP
jgi:DNA-binding beta-propeller fold protein YncE